ncbi:MAG: serine hydrolase, partial [Deltaproteobacteria bacterium]|nr:serine hydrolase [Deltaproteobacteria bacterium]
MTGKKTSKKLSNLMEQGASDGVFPGGVLLVSIKGSIRHHTAHGKLSLQPDGHLVTRETIFDLASLTKPLATTTLILDMIQRGNISLSDSIQKYIPDIQNAGSNEISIQHLLEHSSGLVAWRPYFEELAAAFGGKHIATIRGRDAIRKIVAAEDLSKPAGRHAVYSDLGFILLDWVIELIESKPTDVLFTQRIARPLGLEDLFFVDLKSSRKAQIARKGRVFAMTERCPWRGRTLSGEVHDDNTYAMGGVSGQAGLFGTAHAVHGLARAWLDAYSGRPAVFDKALVRRFWRRSDVAGSDRALGFDTPALKDSQAGRHFGGRSVGHSGFTGTSLWIDPDR